MKKYTTSIILFLISGLLGYWASVTVNGFGVWLTMNSIFTSVTALFLFFVSNFKD